MEFFVFLIYGVIMGELIWVEHTKSKKATSSFYQGHGYYKAVGVTNLLVGMIGLLLFDYFLRDKGIIPAWSFWVGFAGFAILQIIGCINIAKMMMSNQP